MLRTLNLHLSCCSRIRSKGSSGRYRHLPASNCLKIVRTDSKNCHNYSIPSKFNSNLKGCSGFQDEGGSRCCLNLPASDGLTVARTDFKNWQCFALSYLTKHWWNFALFGTQPSLRFERSQVWRVWRRLQKAESGERYSPRSFTLPSHSRKFDRPGA